MDKCSKCGAPIYADEPLPQPQWCLDCIMGDQPVTGYPIILNGDHAEFEQEHKDTPPHERPDWPLPSFDARDWAAAFCKIANSHGFKSAKGEPIDEGWMIGWFSNALMRGYDEHVRRAQDGD